MIYNNFILRWFFRRVITLYKGVLNDRINRNIGIRLRTSRPEGSLIVRNVPHWGGFFIFAIRNEFLKVQLFTFNYLWTSSYIDSIAFTMLHFFELINPNMSPEWYTRIHITNTKCLIPILFFRWSDRLSIFPQKWTNVSLENLIIWIPLQLEFTKKSVHVLFMHTFTFKVNKTPTSQTVDL